MEGSQIWGMGGLENELLLQFLWKAKLLGPFFLRLRTQRLLLKCSLLVIFHFYLFVFVLLQISYLRKVLTAICSVHSLWQV